jgi:hypothetical protein
LQVAPWTKLPAFYLLDCISKNTFDPYARVFAAFISPLFLESYDQVDPATRRKMEEMLLTWRTGAPGGKELFGVSSQVAIERAIWGGSASSSTVCSFILALLLLLFAATNTATIDGQPGLGTSSSLDLPSPQRARIHSRPPSTFPPDKPTRPCSQTGRRDFAPGMRFHHPPAPYPSEHWTIASFIGGERVVAVRLGTDSSTDACYGPTPSRGATAATRGSCSSAAAAAATTYSPTI